MSGQVHQLFSGEADLLAAWERFAALARDLAENPMKMADRGFVDLMLDAEREYKRLFNLSLERGGQ